MPICEMCGSESELFRTLIEGTELNVCEKCAQYGKILERAKAKEGKNRKRKVEEKGKPALPEREVIMAIANGYSRLVKDGREKMGLKQEDFAKLINEKQNLIHNIETGRVEPSITLARKLEKFLKIRLVEEQEVVHEKKKRSETDKFTLGDFIKIRK